LREARAPWVHVALSEALTNFSLYFAPNIVERHQGTLIYAGGDDVLALLPVNTALACARELESTFCQDWAVDGRGRLRLLMGSRDSLSAGLAVVHHKDDLRHALQTARGAQKAAREAGRPALSITVCRRSGADSSAWLGWSQVEHLERLVAAFAHGVSDRWTYRLCSLLPTLAGPYLPPQAFRAELIRQLRRLEEGNGCFGALVEALLDAYHAEWFSARRRNQHAEEDCRAVFLNGFLTLCQTASFLARGEDRR
jgi:CRISPR-associated protein Cmr2